MIKKTFIAILISLSLISCTPIDASLTGGDKNFPLIQAFVFPKHGETRGIAVGDGWFAYRTMDEITAIDIASLKTLWREKFRAISSGEGFQIINGRLIAISNDQVVSWDRQGQRDELLSLDSGDSSVGIIKTPLLYQNYAYIIRGPLWTLEAYDISNKVLLWKTDGIEDAFYDPAMNVAYLITRQGDIQARDNKNGELLWQRSGTVVHGVYAADVLFLYELIKSDGHYEMSAFDVRDQKELWRKNYTNISENDVYKLTVLNQFLITSTRSGLIAFDKHSGVQVWEAKVGEPIETSPIELNGIIYAKGVFDRAIFALSPVDGSIIGVSDLENESIFSGGDIYTGVYKISNGIVFSNRNAIYVYSAR